MTGKLSTQDKKQLEIWIDSGPKTFSLLYSFKRDGSTAPAFHQKCDNKGPTVTVIYNTKGSFYGGYTEQSWDSSSGYKADENAFLFKLQLDGKNMYDKFTILEQRCSYAICCHSKYGPAFGGGHDLHTFNGILSVAGKVYTLNGYTTFGNSYDMKGIASSQITNDIKTVTELEVYAVTDALHVDLVTDEPSVELPEQWRTIPKWDLEFLDELKDEIENYSPPQALKVKQARILVLGPVGAGKSSFFNTVSSVFRGYVTRQACSGSAGQSITTKYNMYQVRSKSTGQPLNFRLCDTRGLEENQGIDAQELGYILDGNVPGGYQFNPSIPISPDIQGFKTTPALGDKIHCVCFVIDGSTADVLPEKLLEKIKSLQIKIHQKGVPQAVLLTKIDAVCSLVKSDLSSVFHSSVISDLVDNVSQILGVPRGTVLPMKNYEQEINVSDDVNLLALLSLRQMLRSAEDFMFNYLDEAEESCNLSDTL